MQNTDNSVLDTFKQDTKRYLDIFCAEYGIEDLMKAPQNTFESALSYAGDHVFLKPENVTLKYNRQTILDCDNAELINYILDYYIFICGVYNKESNIQGFAKYIKISEQTMYNWKNGEYKTKIYIDTDGNVIKDIQEWKGKSSNTVEYYVNGIKRNKTEYMEILRRIADPDTIAMCSNARVFLNEIQKATAKAREALQEEQKKLSQKQANIQQKVDQLTEYSIEKKDKEKDNNLIVSKDTIRQTDVQRVVEEWNKLQDVGIAPIRDIKPALLANFSQMKRKMKSKDR